METSSGTSYICFFETDALAIFGYQDNVLLIIRCLYFNQLVIISRVIATSPVLAHICILFHRSFLNKTLTCCHHHIMSFFKLADRNN